MTRSEVRVPHRPPITLKLWPIQFCERIRKVERKRLGNIASSAQQTCFVGSMARLPSRVDDGVIAQLARAPALQAGGPGFESPSLHQRKKTSENLVFFLWWGHIFGAVFEARRSGNT